MKHLAEHGWQADRCLVAPDETATQVLELQLATQSYDCVVMGGGIRIPPGSLLLFERLLNTVQIRSRSVDRLQHRTAGHRRRATARWLDPPTR